MRQNVIEHLLLFRDCQLSDLHRDFVNWFAFIALTPLVGWQEGHTACKKTEWWGAGMVICLEWRAYLHTAQLMPLPLTVSCFSKIQIGFTFLLPALSASPGQRAIKPVCVCVCVFVNWNQIHIVQECCLLSWIDGCRLCDLCVGCSMYGLCWMPHVWSLCWMQHVWCVCWMPPVWSVCLCRSRVWFAQRRPHDSTSAVDWRSQQVQHCRRCCVQRPVRIWMSMSYLTLGDHLSWKHKNSCLNKHWVRKMCQGYNC